MNKHRERERGRAGKRGGSRYVHFMDRSFVFTMLPGIRIKMSDDVVSNLHKLIFTVLVGWVMGKTGKTLQHHCRLTVFLPRAICGS